MKNNTEILKEKLNEVFKEILTDKRDAEEIIEATLSDTIEDTTLYWSFEEGLACLSELVKLGYVDEDELAELKIHIRNLVNHTLKEIILDKLFDVKYEIFDAIDKQEEEE
jgi:hypothetical protein